MNTIKGFFAAAAIAATALSFSSEASAQVRVGVKGGLTASWIPGSIQVTTASRVLPHNNFYAGIEADANLGDYVMGEIDVLYTGKGYSSKAEVLSVVGRTNLNISYIRVPLMFGANLLEGRYNIMIGPDFGWAVGGTMQYTDNGGINETVDIKEYLQPFNLGIALQTGYMITDGLGIDVKFDWGITRTFNKIWEVEGVSVQTNAHNLSVNIGLVYKFEL